MAPLAVGAAVMLVAASIATVVRPAERVDDGPELSAAALELGPVPAPVISPSPTTEAALPSPTPAPSIVEVPATEVPATEAPADRAPAAPAPEPLVKKVVAPAAPAVPTGGGDGTQAAATRGWTLVGGDEFDAAISSKWGPYEGAGHDGNGRRTADAISVENGSLVIRGDGNGTTGGMSWQEEQRFGKWEMRARFPKGDEQYHPVLLLWPNGAWPAGGEVDFAETTSASPDVSFFLHYSSSNQQKYAERALDITQWHNYAVEWVDGRITGYVDGEQWFESTDPGTLPPDRMHAAIQLDYFPNGGSPQPSEMYVDYLRIYR